MPFENYNYRFNIVVLSLDLSFVYVHISIFIHSTHTFSILKISGNYTPTGVLLAVPSSCHPPCTGPRMSREPHSSHGSPSILAASIGLSPSGARPGSRVAHRAGGELVDHLGATGAPIAACFSQKPRG